MPQPDSNNLSVCVIDSGVKANHSDLQQFNFTGYDKEYSGLWDEDSVGHGTHVAGIISAVRNNQGITGAIDNEQINIQVEKLVSTGNAHNSKISDSALIEAIESCASSGSKIINMSLSGSHYSEGLRNVIDRLTYEEDIIFVAAAGNHGTGTGVDHPAFPAAYRNVVSVGAVNINNELAPFSPVYNGVTFVAPGVDILSTVNHEKNVVKEIFYESENGVYSFEFSQLDKGNFDYPSSLPEQSSCYYELPLDLVKNQIKKQEITQENKDSVYAAAESCSSEGGQALVLTYDFISTTQLPELEMYDTWLKGLDIDATLPTVLIPGLSTEELQFFEEGNIQLSVTKNDYLPLSGTSQSAAITTAGLAKLWSNFPDASSAEILNALKYTTDKLKYDYPKNAYGHGLVNFGSAFDYLNTSGGEIKPEFCPESWHEDKNYQYGEEVSHDGIIYKANHDSVGESPATSNAWSIVDPTVKTVNQQI